VDLCGQLLQAEAILRPSAVEALNHPFFDKGKESLEDLFDFKTASALVDTMKEAARRSTFQRAVMVHTSSQLDIEPVSSMTHVFTAWDRYGEGTLSLAEIQDGIGNLPTSLSATSRSGDADDLALAMDVNGTGKGTFTEWCAAVMDAQKVDPNLVKALFDRRSEDGKHVDLYDVEAIMRTAGVGNKVAHAEARRIGKALKLLGRNEPINTGRLARFFLQDSRESEILDGAPLLL
jgi:hypothetical protein